MLNRIFSSYTKKTAVRINQIIRQLSEKRASLKETLSSIQMCGYKKKRIATKERKEKTDDGGGRREANQFHVEKNTAVVGVVSRWFFFVPLICSLERWNTFAFIFIQGGANHVSVGQLNRLTRLGIMPR